MLYGGSCAVVTAAVWRAAQARRHRAELALRDVDARQPELHRQFQPRLAGFAQAVDHRQHVPARGLHLALLDQHEAEVQAQGQRLLHQAPGAAVFEAGFEVAPR